MLNNSKIKTGDLLFFRPTGWVGRLICLVTRSEYCHVGLAYVGVLENIHLCEYREFGYREIELKEAIKEWGDSPDVWRVEEKYHEVYHMPSTATYMIATFNKNYGWFHFIKIAFFMLFFRWVTMFFVPKECEKHAPTCSESVCMAYRKGCGVDLVTGIPDRLTSPGDIISGGKIKKVI
jgi:hypothetical protein